MKRALLYFSLFILSFSTVYAQSDATKHGTPKKVKPAYKQGPSYIDANLYKVPRIQQDSKADSTGIKKKLKPKTVNKNSFGPVSADYPPDPDLALQDSAGVYFETPHSVAWFTFTASIDTVLTFDIVPTDTGDDIDFLLFKDETGNFANDLKAHKTRPIRSNMARCDKNFDCKTGLSAKGKHSYEALGKHNPYSSPVRVKKGEHFFLAVDNCTHADRPFSLFLHLRWPAFVKQAPPKPHPVEQKQKMNSYIDANPIMAPHIQQPVKDSSTVMQPAPVQPVPVIRPKLTKTILTVKVVDSIGNPVKAELDIDGMMADKTMTMIATQDSFMLDPLQSVRINCNAPGFVFAQASYLAPDTPTRAYITITVNAIREGQSIILKGIQFEEGNAKLLNSSNGPLMNVVEFLRSNTKVKIMIKGYVNDPFGTNSGPAKKLSKERAEAVRNFLRDKGISVNRMDYKGYGNENMLFPHPINNTQEQANRRVEVEIK